MEKNFSQEYWEQNKIDLPKEIHKQRCDMDPIYRLLFAETGKFTDELLEVCIAVVQKKYGKRFCEHKSINYMFELLRKTKEKTIKRIAIIFCMYWESHVYQAIRDLYTDKGIFDDKGRDHYLMFYNKMGEFVEQTIRFPCNEQNIIEMMENFEKGARVQYLIH